MTNAFEKDYQIQLKIKAAYDKAEAAGDENGTAAAREEIHKFWDEINAKGQAYIHLMREYETARDNGNDLLDLQDTIWEKDVKELVDCMREYGIGRFTFSSTWSSSVEIAWLFTKNGCALEGMTTVQGSEKLFSREREISPAFLFRVNG